MSLHAIRRGGTQAPTRGDTRAQDRVVAPIPNWQDSVSSRFGRRANPTGAGSEFHSGMDIAKPQGTPIQAAKDGKVVFAGDGGGYGNLVVIQHRDGTYSLYAHQASLDVRAGQEVKAGDVIGKVGSTGRSTGPHLHFEVRAGGADWNSAKPVDPVAFLNGATNQAPADPGPAAPAPGGSTPDVNVAGGGSRPSGLGLPPVRTSGSGPSGGGRPSAPAPGPSVAPAPGGGRGASPSAPPTSLAKATRDVADAILADAEIQAALANWENLTTEQKLAIARKIAQLQGKAFGFDPEMDIRFDPSLDAQGILGLASADGITLSRAALADPKRFVDTVVHEQAHIYDRQAGAGLAAPNHNDGDVGDGVYRIGHAVSERVFAA